ncbi:hypothetical protein Tco_0526109 [Tanacetum coccineum]
MTKQGNFTQRTPQAKKQSDQASKQVSKQASGSTNAPHDLVFPATGPSLGTTQPTATITSTEDLQRVAFTTPPQTAPGTNSTEPPPPPIRNKGPELGADNLTLEGVATELAPSDFVSQNYETLVALMQEETKKRSSQSLQARLNFGPEDEVSPPRHRKERRREDNRRPPVFGRIGKQVSGTQTANLQNLSDLRNQSHILPRVIFLQLATNNRQSDYSISLVTTTHTDSSFCNFQFSNDTSYENIQRCTFIIIFEITHIELRTYTWASLSFVLALSVTRLTLRQ